MALPLILSIAGGILPSIVSAIAGAKSPEEARAAAKPEYDALVAQLIGRGLPRAAAEAEADKSITGVVEQKMQEGALPGWAEGLLGVAGGIGGWMAGAKLAARGAAKALAKDAAKVASPEAASKPPPVPDAYKRDAPSRRKLMENEVNAEAAAAGRFDRVAPEGDSGGELIIPPFSRARPVPREMEADAEVLAVESIPGLMPPFRRR